MKLYYAMGSGLGHLARAAAFLLSQNIPSEQVILLTASHHIGFGGLPEGLEVLTIPSVFSQQKENYQSFLEGLIQQYNIEEVYLDAFPVGILGEWCFFGGQPDLKFYYIARLLNWEIYAPLLAGTNIQFVKTFCTEKLTTLHQAFVHAHSESVLALSLHYPEVAMSQQDTDTLEALRLKHPCLWLIVHSEPVEELEMLIAHAISCAALENIAPKYLVISQVRPSEAHEYLLYLEAIPNTFIFEKVDKIFTACGFNLMQQTQAYQHKHIFIPMQRRYDLQFERARRRRSAE